MYNTSAEFKKKIVSTMREIRGYVTIGSNTFSDTSELVSIKISQTAIDNVIVGQVISKSAEIELNIKKADYLVKFNVDSEVAIYLGLQLDADIEYIPQAKMLIKKFDYDEDKGILTISCVDYMTEADSYMISEITIDYPTTIDDYLAEICNVAGITKSLKAYWGSNTVVSEAPNFSGSESLREAIKGIAQTCLANCYMNKSGELEVSSIVGATSQDITADNYFTATFGDKIIGINSIILSRQPQQDIIYANDETLIARDGLSQIVIENNPFMDSDRASFAPILLAKVKGLSFYPCEIDWRGNFAFECFETLSVTTVDGGVISSFLFSEELDFNGGLNSKITNKCSNKIAVEYAKGSTIKDKIRNAEIEVDKVKNQILLTVSQTTFDNAIEDVSADITASQTTANTANANAVIANNLLADLANDDKLTPDEKQATQKEWNIIVSEKTKIDAQATTYGVTTEKTDYATSYTALLNYVIPLLANLTTTSNIIGVTFRANFKDYYDKKQLLLNAIANKSKAIADAAQTAANTAKTTADTAVANAQTAQTTANSAITNASTANNLLADIASDSKFTAIEKQLAQTEWNIIVSEKTQIDTQATAYAITAEKTVYGTSYTTLSNYITPLLVSLTTTSDIVSATFRANFKDYYDKKQLLLNAIAVKAKTLADTAQTTANAKVGKTTIISEINQTAEAITITANKIGLLGATNIPDLTAEKITSGLLKSQNYVANTTGTKFSLVDGTIDSKNFKVDAYGRLTVTSGTFGALSITSDGRVYVNGGNGLLNVGKNGENAGLFFTAIPAQEEFRNVDIFMAGEDLVIRASSSSEKDEFPYMPKILINTDVYVKGNPVASYHIGAVYISFDPTSPASLFGGAWERISERFLWCTNFDAGVGAVGGENSHTLSSAEIASHRHNGLYWSDGTEVSFNGGTMTGFGVPYTYGNVANVGASNLRFITGYTGGTQPHNNVPAYVAVAAWRRIS